jgi:hypothetical protein
MDDGPFCVLCAVDAPKQRRLLYDVLDHDPDHDDIRRFLRRLQQAITARAGIVHGITTDGSALDPVPLAEIFESVPHQVCEFHVLKELTKVVLRALARIRKRLAAGAPKRPRGRPRKGSAARRGASRIEPRGSSNGWRSCSSTVTCSSATISASRSGRGCGNSAGASPNFERSVPSWTRWIGCSIVAAGRMLR